MLFLQQGCTKGKSSLSVEGVSKDSIADVDSVAKILLDINKYLNYREITPFIGVNNSFQESQKAHFTCGDHYITFGYDEANGLVLSVNNRRINLKDKITINEDWSCEDTGEGSSMDFPNALSTINIINLRIKN